MNIRFSVLSYFSGLYDPVSHICKSFHVCVFLNKIEILLLKTFHFNKLINRIIFIPSCDVFLNVRKYAQWVH